MKKTFIFILMALMLLGCKGEKGDQGPIGPSLSGTLNGQVFLIDENGVRLSNHSGVAISIDGTNYFAVTDSLGNWSIPNIITGTYNILLSKPGYANYKITSFQFVGGGSVYAYERYLLQTPSFNIQSLSVGRSISDKTITISGQTAPASSQSRTAMIFINTKSNVSSLPTEYVVTRSAYTEQNLNSFNLTIYSFELRNQGITSGTKLYFRAYPNISGWISGYADQQTGNTIYTSIGPNGSNIDSIVVP